MVPDKEVLVWRREDSVSLFLEKWRGVRETLLRWAPGRNLQETKNKVKGFRITLLGNYIQAPNFPRCQLLASVWQ